MDQEQFVTLIQGFQEQEVNRRQETQVRSRINKIQTCDGSSAPKVREWLKEVELAINIIGNDKHVQIATSSISGPMMFELERYIDRFTTRAQCERAAVPWADIKRHTQTQFLGSDDRATLRDDLENTRQTSFETEVAFSRRFIELAEGAFPNAQRNDDQNRTIVRAFARGLSCPKIAQKLIEHHEPDTLDEAVDAVAEIISHREAYLRLGRKDTRQEEPMEIGAAKPDANKDDLAMLIRAVNSLVGTVDKQSSKIAKIEADRSMDRVPQQKNDRDRLQRRAGNGQQPIERFPNWDEQGNPRCFQCNQYGHLAAECRRRQGILYCPECKQYGHTAVECRQQRHYTAAPTKNSMTPQ